MVALVKATVRRLDPNNLLCEVYWTGLEDGLLHSITFNYYGYKESTGHYPKLGDEVDVDPSVRGLGVGIILGFSL